MNIIVCVKQVPGVSNVEIDPVTGVLKRDGTKGKLNPYDLFALEMAFSVKDKFDGKVKAFSMGPNQAIAQLWESIYMGADEGYLLSDRLFAGSDVYSTSYAISKGIEKTGKYDLIICGKQTTDGDTAQVGPEVSEWLGIEHATNVMRIDSISDKEITITCNMDDCYQTQTMKLPCLITVEKDALTPRLPSYLRKKQFNDNLDAIKTFTAKDIEDLDSSKCGLKGSPTRVEKIFPPEKNVEKIMHKGDSQRLSEELYDILKTEKFI